MEKNPFAFNGAIFTTIKKMAKSGKEYIPGEATVEGKKYALYVYERESKAGKKYLSIIGNEMKESGEKPVQETMPVVAAGKELDEELDRKLLDSVPF